MILPLTQDRLADVHRPNEPFPIIGRVIPSLTEGEWGYREELFDTPGTKCYPDEERDYSLYINSPDRAVFLDYEGKACAGQIVLRADWNRYVFVEDICVAAAFRGRGIGTSLMKRAACWGKERGLRGIALETQDVNLLACRFYRRFGMRLGGVNTMLYRQFDKPVCGETALFWYLEFTDEANEQE
ncbi:MAG TPA: GNAT family N-acetyltransferase [Candidatus Merdivicinus intestinavium]|nr:GNAT family N-acetyltransferase [Candidatus Merdivicinus intestinavium]